MATGNDMGTGLATSPVARTAINMMSKQIAEKTADVLVTTAGQVAGQAAEKSKKTFLGLSVSSFYIPKFIKDKFQSIGQSEIWKSIKSRACTFWMKTEAMWGSMAKYGVGGALVGAYLIPSGFGLGLGMGAGLFAGSYVGWNQSIPNAVNDANERQLKDDKLAAYKKAHGDINPYETEAT
jgi:hypothetical protein